MKHTLDYTFEKVVCHNVKVSVKLDEKLDDIIEYLYERKFKDKFRPNAYRLEPGAKEFVSDIEDKWWNNKLDTIELYRDYDFKEWLKEKYYEQTVGKLSLEDVIEDSSIDYDDLDYSLEV